MEAVRFSETTVLVYKTTWRNTPEGNNPKPHSSIFYYYYS
jgi:hypothetical protein